MDEHRRFVDGLERRLRVVEAEVAKVVGTQNALENRMDIVKADLDKRQSAEDAWKSAWDERWKKIMKTGLVLCGILIGLTIAAGSGVVSLKSLLEWMAK
jgi:hypothetical protein